MNFLPLIELPILHETFAISFVVDGVLGVPTQINARWTPEMAQDLANFHHFGIDATEEMVNALAAQVDREILNNIFNMDRQQQGYVYVPYNIATDIPADFQPREGIATRYARQAVNPGYYQVIRIASADYPNGLRFKFTQAEKVDGVEFFEIDKMPLPKENAKNKLRKNILEKWLREGLLDNFIVEELPE